MLSGVLQPEIQNNVYVKKFISEFGGFAGHWNDEHITRRAEIMADRGFDSIWAF